METDERMSLRPYYSYPHDVLAESLKTGGIESQFRNRQEKEKPKTLLHLLILHFALFFFVFLRQTILHFPSNFRSFFFWVWIPKPSFQFLVTKNVKL